MIFAPVSHPPVLMNACSLVAVWVWLFLQAPFLVLPTASGTVFLVGGDKGWVVGLVNYTEWAAIHTFYAGDSLVFTYEPEVHTVLEVTRRSFTGCSVSSPVASYDDGNTTIHLGEAGTYYFICGVFQHCPAGQKLEVVALEAPAEAPVSPPPMVAGGPHRSMQPAPQSSLTSARFNPSQRRNLSNLVIFSSLIYFLTSCV